MTLVAQYVHGVGANYVQLIVAGVLAWGFVTGHVTVYAMTIKRGVRK